MNRIELTGYLKTVTAYTDEEIKVEDAVEWRRRSRGSETTFYTDDKSWVRVVFDEWLYCYMIGTDRIKKHLKIIGELRAEVSLGSGIVTNYIKVTGVEVLQEEENE